MSRSRRHAQVGRKDGTIPDDALWLSATFPDDVVVYGYWDSWSGRWRRQRTRHFRTFHLVIPGEPIQKGDRRAAGREGEIREQVARELRGFNRSTLTRSVALSLWFETARRNPPDLPKLAKYLLDVLGGRHGVAVPKPFLYRDDSQVKMLHVIWSCTDDPTTLGSTRVIARPLRDVVEDLRLSRELHLAIGCDDDDSPFAFEDLREDYEDDDLLDDEWLPADLRLTLRQLERRQRQGVLLQRSSAYFRSVLASTPERVAGGLPQRLRPELAPFIRELRDQLEMDHDGSWDLLLSQPLTAPVPSLPAASGETAIFRATLRAQLKEFAARWTSMVPLEEPLNATILVVPPEQWSTKKPKKPTKTRSKQQGKDLDNIGLTVLPALREALRPDAPGALGIASYQVIELGRRPSDPPEGYLRVLLGEHRYQSDWDRIAWYVNDHADEQLD